jgi:opacity protein-like surface antigen
MLFRKIAFVLYLACFVPITAFGTMIYVPSNPCACDNRPCDDVVILSRDFRKSGVVQRAEQVEKPKPAEVRKANTFKNQDNEPEYDVYLAGNLAMNIWNWKNDYNSDYTGTDLLFSQDEYSGENVFGGNVALGFYFSKNWRADVELGITKEFEDYDEAATYTLSMPYLMGNAYYDFNSGFYLGGGLGIVRSKISIDGLLFQNSTSGAEYTDNLLKVGVTAGYAFRVGDNMHIDLRYRLSGIQGPEVSRTFWWDQYNDGNYREFILKITSGLVLENAFSVGLRVSF